MIKFSKMHGVGNDFILIDGHDYLGDYNALAKKICDRHFGIGADGLMISKESINADIKMIYINSDGSTGEMCGNGIRCFSKFVYKNRLVLKDEFSIETLAGIKKVKLFIEDAEVVKIKVSMGEVIDESKLIPIDYSGKTFYDKEIKILDKTFRLSFVLSGVPHAVIFLEKLDKEILLKYGPEIEKNEIFTNNTNVNFVEVIGRNQMKIDTWERGAGNTLACGTGAVACVYVANKLGFIDNEVNVSLPGGELSIILDFENNEIYMYGPASTIAEGVYNNTEG
ncbi:diaminopimelate epimerase [Helicovermis profundi]|uniref:Diaminopimelate epimerase n=1 Tax=Helicovermis profundi TaxID=3065157 RepID=A0AAU9EMY1_9FIRM|nr:diaminopimelate epimerase [Clostridia bacterium S502]